MVGEAGIAFPGSAAAPSIQEQVGGHCLTNAVLVTAARVRMLLNLNGHGGAAARARMVWTPPSEVSVTI